MKTNQAKNQVENKKAIHSDRDYDFQRLEDQLIERWEQEKIYQTPTAGVTAKNKCYVLPQLPYPSGSGLHVGHASTYIPADIYARFQRMKGKKVMQVMGWDSFGLPAENYAIKTNIHPHINTEQAIKNFIFQIKKMGISVDWAHEVGSHRPDYYQWTQWLFLLMHKMGLAYRAKQQVNWCPSCKTVLANDQVKDGACERCDSKVEQKQKEVWYLKITAYADRLADDLDKVDWPAESIKRQRYWIGRKKGIEIDYPVQFIQPGDQKLAKPQKSHEPQNPQKSPETIITCFSTRPDTNFGASFIVLAPEHPFVQQLLEQKIAPQQDKNGQALSADQAKVVQQHVQAYVQQALAKTELERQQEGRTKTGVFTGCYALNRLTNKTLPIWVSDFVLMNFGTGAVVGVPGHDGRDFEFAQKFNLEITRVVQGPDGDQTPITQAAQIFEDEGVTINSGFLNGQKTQQAITSAMDYLEKKGWGRRKTTYRLKDWSVSRQRFWGAPVPMVFDPQGVPHPVQPDDLPVKLPDDVDFKPTGQSPLTYSKKFQQGVEAKYGKGWHREVDTLDTFMCSSWYYFRYADPQNSQEFASQELIKRWLPVDFYLGGREHVTGHLLYARFFTKVLFDAGYIDFDEPFLFHRHQGTIWGEDNRKMSKRWGNVINPIDEIKKFGADTLRVYQMFMGPLEDDKAWNTNAEQGVSRFLKRVWGLQSKVVPDQQVKQALNRAGSQFELAVLVDQQAHWINALIKKVETDIQNLSFNTAVAKFMEFVNFATQQPLIMQSVWEKFILVFAPFAPFITEQLWQNLQPVAAAGKAERSKTWSVHQQRWPKFDPLLATAKTVIVIVQVNGKLRGELEVQASEIDTQTQLLAQAKKLESVQKWLTGKKIKKEIYIPGKVINFVV